jgi:hypothetical protein
MVHPKSGETDLALFQRERLGCQDFLFLGERLLNTAQDGGLPLHYPGFWFSAEGDSSYLVRTKIYEPLKANASKKPDETLPEEWLVISSGFWIPKAHSTAGRPALLINSLYGATEVTKL